MMLKSSKKVDTNRYELEITIDKEKFAEAVMKAYRKTVKNINVPGFRKGKAPKNIIEKMYGESVFYEDALDILYPEAVEGAIKEADLKFVDDKIDFDLVSIGKEGVEFKVKITVYPEVTVAEYKGIVVEKNAVSVTAKEVEEELSRLAERNARMVSVDDRAAEMGDTAVIDFEGFVDGVAFDGGKGEAFSLGLGSGQFIPGFEEQVAGHNIGEEFDVNVTFPEEYQAEELAGKPAVFKVKLHEIKKREVPVIDDEFAKDVSEFDTVDELKKDLKAKALERKKKAAEEQVENAIVDKIVEGMTAEIPEAMITNRVKQMVQDFAYRLQMQGMNLETYIKYTGSDMAEFEKTFRPQAEKQVKMRLALEKIVELENIVPTEEEINAQIEKMANDYGVTVEQVKNAIPTEEIAKDLAVNKAIDLVKAEAVITEAKKTAAKKTTTKKADGEEKPAAKKSTAKKTTKKEEEKAE
ncbi:MAG: trigger factor [Ruminococcaceae bacterium]|nr:trigger factor [Oscillospiraceae bacterium]